MNHYTALWHCLRLHPLVATTATGTGTGTGTAPEDQGGGHHRPRPREEQWAENNVSKYHMAVAVSEYGSWCASRCKRGEDEGDGEGICEVQ